MKESQCHEDAASINMPSFEREPPQQAQLNKPQEQRAEREEVVGQLLAASLLNKARVYSRRVIAGFTYLKNVTKNWTRSIMLLCWEKAIYGTNRRESGVIINNKVSNMKT